ncbi:cartilage intermediate layer protein 2 [Kryptolebias marmoratus]|uniref:cartilage intermediate layer protein 2 n=1 Tax=Kryptolebias marmoratus TaxID=37003 RepID=UPI0007F8D3A5|nr:cartilage intermediate layer protein 2 [Kryptolebias marmoratus]
MIKFIFTFAAVLLLGYVDLSHQMPPTLEPEDCWTKWFNRDNPGGPGDWETLEKLRAEYPGQICRRPLDIEAVTAARHIPAEITQQKFYAYNTKTGFICRNQDQKQDMCFDYKVRFRCPCRF